MLDVAGHSCAREGSVVGRWGSLCPADGLVEQVEDCVLGVPASVEAIEDFFEREGVDRGHVVDHVDRLERIHTGGLVNGEACGGKRFGSGDASAGRVELGEIVSEVDGVVGEDLPGPIEVIGDEVGAGEQRCLFRSAGEVPVESLLCRCGFGGDLPLYELMGRCVSEFVEV